MKAFRESGYLERITKERAAGTRKVLLLTREKIVSTKPSTRLQTDFTEAISMGTPRAQFPLYEPATAQVLPGI